MNRCPTSTFKTYRQIQDKTKRTKQQHSRNYAVAKNQNFTVLLTAARLPSFINSHFLPLLVFEAYFIFLICTSGSARCSKAILSLLRSSSLGCLCFLVNISGSARFSNFTLYFLFFISPHLRFYKKNGQNLPPQMKLPLF